MRALSRYGCSAGYLSTAQSDSQNVVHVFYMYLKKRRSAGSNIEGRQWELGSGSLCSRTQPRQPPRFRRFNPSHAESHPAAGSMYSLQKGREFVNNKKRLRRVASGRWQARQAGRQATQSGHFPPTLYPPTVACRQGDRGGTLVVVLLNCLDALSRPAEGPTNVRRVRQGEWVSDRDP